MKRSNLIAVSVIVAVAAVVGLFAINSSSKTQSGTLDLAAGISEPRMAVANKASM